MRILFTILIFISGFSLPLYAYDSEALKAKLSPEKEDFFTSKVIEIIDGDTLRLDNKMEVRLVGLQAPKIVLSRKNFREWPLGYEAKEALVNITLNKNVSLYYGGRRMDRYGRLLAHLFLEDGAWVQGEMLKNGMARVYSFADNRSIVTEMLAEEKIAFDNNRGIWNLDFYKIKKQEDSNQYTNSFQIISGKVIEVATVRSTTFLNFGDDYKTDFTVVIQGRVKTMMEKNNQNIKDFEDKDILVRGWLKYYNGPSIELTHPEQIIINQP